MILVVRFIREVLAQFVFTNPDFMLTHICMSENSKMKQRYYEKVVYRIWS